MRGAAAREGLGWPSGRREAGVEADGAFCGRGESVRRPRGSHGRALTSLPGQSAGSLISEVFLPVTRYWRFSGAGVRGTIRASEGGSGPSSPLSCRRRADKATGTLRCQS